MKRILFLFLFVNVLFAYSQEDMKNNMIYVYINGGDTSYFMMLSEAEIYGKVNMTLEERKQYDKLVRHVLKVYPYVKIAGDKLRQYQYVIDSLPTKKERRQFLKKIENELWNSYGDELKKLTFTQGQILIKLLDRETQNTGYALLKELRGSIRAFFYQGFARLWGYNLKTEYNPSGDDWMIEYIVQKIERGEL